MQNIRKQIDYKKTSNTMEMNRVQNNKDIQCLEILTGMFVTFIFCFYLLVLS